MSSDNRNDQRGDQGGARISQKKEERRNHEQRANREVLAHRDDGGDDEVGAIERHIRDDPGGQCLGDAAEPGVHGLGDDSAVAADQHERRADHDFVAVLARRSGAKLSADPNPGDVLDGERDALAGADDRAFDVIHGAKARIRANQVDSPAR